MRSVRKVTIYICTHNMKAYPDAESARKAAEEYLKNHKKPTKTTRKGGRRGTTQTGRVLNAIRGGSSTAKEVAKKTRIPLPRVHSLLTYLRKRGQIQGYASDLKAVK